MSGLGERPEAPIVVVGVRQVLAPLPDGPRTRLADAVEFIVNHPLNEGRRIYISSFKDNGDVVEVVDLLRAREGEPYVWRFENLSMDVFDGMAEHVLGYDVLRRSLTTTDDVQNFYIEEYLHDGWTNRTGETLEEAKAYPIGHISHRSDGYDYQKQPNGEWVNIGPTFRVRHDLPTFDPDDEPEEDSDLLDDVPTGGPWKEYAEGLPSNTFREYYEDDPELMHLPEEYRKRPNAERKRVVDRILRTLNRRLFKGRTPVPEDQAPIAVLTMGVPASGKSSAVKNVVSGNDLVHIDPDLIKEAIPEYQQAKNQRAKNAAGLVHQESGWLAEQIRDEAVRQRMNLVFEGVGRDAEYYQDMIQWLRLNGYRIQLVLTHVEDAELAVARSNERGEKSGRWVPEERIREAIPLVPKNFLEIAPEADDFAVFDSSSFPLRLAWAREEGKEYVPDEDLRDRMLRAGGQPVRARAVEATASEKPPSMKAGDVQERFIKAWEVDHALFALTPKRFRKGQGVNMPGTDAPMRLKMPKSSN